MTEKLIFLGGGGSLADEAADLLLQMASIQGGTADFQGTLVTLPTREAGRLLREALLKKLPGGMMNFRTVQPAGWFHGGGTLEAGQLECAGAWLNVLPSALKKGLAEHLFPLSGDVVNQPEVLLNLAETLQRCRVTLAGEGYTVQEAAGLLRETGGEDLLEKSERFDDFVELEKLYLDELQRLDSSVCDPAAAILNGIKNPELPGINQLVVIGCPQLSRGMRLFLDKLPPETKLTIAVDAVPEYGRYLDVYGCPEIQGEAGRFWKELDCGIDLEKSVRFTPDTFGEVRAAERFLTDKNFNPGAIGVLDNEAAGLLLRRAGCRKDGLVLFKPENAKLSGGTWTGLLLELLNFFNHPDADLNDVVRLLHSGKLCRYLENRYRITARQLMSDLDTLQSASAVDNLYDWCDAAQAPLNVHYFSDGSSQLLQNLLDRHRLWQENPDGRFDSLLSFWQEIGEANLSGLSRKEAEMESAELSALLPLLREIQKMAETMPDAWQPLLRHAVGSANAVPVIPEKAVELAGFAELNWRGEDSLLIIGFNEENFHPDTGADNLLPERFRLRAGMAVEANRCAADVLRLAALVRRHPGGKLVIYAAGKRLDGSILHPARLLLQCADDALPQRLRLLMPELGNRRLLEENSANLDPLIPHVIPHCADLKKEDNQLRISVTDVTSYLQGPFRFWRSKLGDKIVDGREPELNDMVIGTLIHKVLEDFAGDVTVKDSTSSLEIECYCQKKCQALLDDCFGKKRSGFIRLQENTLSGMLRNFAAFQAQVRSYGWQIFDKEVKIENNWEDLFSSGFDEAPPPSIWRKNCTLVGKIDRIDAKYDDAGKIVKWRVIDYKTHANPGKILERLFTSSPAVKEWKENNFTSVTYLDVNGRTGKTTEKRRFLKDPQLILYHFIVRLLLKQRGIELNFNDIEAGLWELCDRQSTPVYFYDIPKKVITEEVFSASWLWIDRILKNIYFSGGFDKFTPLFFSRQNENDWRDWPESRLNLDWLKTAAREKSCNESEDAHV